ncbi:hypothetical protein LCGC14_2731810, partial [marine sediment metagenome]
MILLSMRKENGKLKHCKKKLKKKKGIKMEELANESTFRSYMFFWSGQLISLMG